jgi:hypothetical protein
LSQTFTLTNDQRAAFERTGLLSLPGLYPRAEAERMADALWADLGGRFDVRRDDPTTWTVIRPMHFQAVVGAGAFAALDTPALAALSDQILGPDRWERPHHWGGPLVTFPAAELGDGRAGWHFDLPGPGRPWPFPVLRLFVFLEPSGPGGGGTLCIAGSAALAARVAPSPVPSKKLRQKVNARYPEIAALYRITAHEVVAMAGRPFAVDGVDLEVVQLTGEPGDAWIMHPLTLHGGSANTADGPRMMLAESILAKPRARASPRRR